MKSKQHFKRRDFLKTVSAAAVAAPLVITSNALGNAVLPPASERIVMGGIGLGNMGRGDMGAFAGNPSVQYVAVCDVRKNVMMDKKNRIDARYRNKDCKAIPDFRDLLARKDIDAVHIATPDHWHVIMITMACKQGKDVYCQKPETFTLREGKIVVDVARRYNRVVSGGSQRVLQDYRRQLDQCWGGKIGTLKSINVNTGNFSSVCNLPAEPVPDNIDWEMWLGPAPWAPYNSKRCSGSYNTSGNAWRAYNDYSGGSVTDWGAHHFGGATFVADVRDLQPTKVTYTATKRQPHLTFEYPNGFVLHHCKPNTGNMHLEGTPGETLDPKPIPKYRNSRTGRGSIYGDFLECVKTGEKPFRDIQWAVNTMCVCHLATIANTLKRNLTWDPKTQSFPGDEAANRLVDRARREPWQL